MERIETTILRNLIFDEEYSRKVIPFIEPDYFENKTEKIIFQETTQFLSSMMLQLQLKHLILRLKIALT